MRGKGGAVDAAVGAFALPSDQDATGRTLGMEELALLTEVIRSGKLFGPKGRYVKELEAEFTAWSGSGHAVACSSGTAAVHTAIAAIDPEPGEEIITTPITDIGALTPILYQGAIPVFADVEPDSGNISATTVREKVSARTRAVIVTHLFGNPVDMSAIREAVGDIPVIEDCAQAFGAAIGQRPVGTYGDAAIFSLQQGKHITSGEGGLVTTSDPELARRMRLFVNKAWDYEEPSDHDFLALNYRLSELQAAVGLAQLRKLDTGIETRRKNAARLTRAMRGVPGVSTVASAPNGRPSFWRYGLMIDSEVVPGGTDALAAKLRRIGVPAASRYIKKPAFMTGLFTNQRTFGRSKWPFSLARHEALDYSPEAFTGAFEFLSRVLVLPWNERFGQDDVDHLSEVIAAGVSALMKEAA